LIGVGEDWDYLRELAAKKKSEEDELAKKKADEDARLKAIENAKFKADEEAKRIAEDIFPEFQVGILHGKMKPDEKEWVMEEFKKGAIHILVATSVIEVGVNVPNATMIAIEGAERYTTTDTYLAAESRSHTE